MTLQIADEVTLHLDRPAHGGFCVGRVDGQVVFARYGVPGEDVRVTVTEIGSGGKFVRADVIEVLSASPDRVQPRCAHAHPSGCGGCDWQHVSIGRQRAIKAEVIREQLVRVGKLPVDHPLLTALTVNACGDDADGFGYRTRMDFVGDKRGRLGLRSARSHDVVPTQGCPLAVSAINEDEAMIDPWRVGGIVRMAAASDGVAVVPEDAATVTVRERVGGAAFAVAAEGFWQVHRNAPLEFTRLAEEMLAPKPGEFLLDLFAGVGLFARMLAPVLGAGGRVIAVESNQQAARFARRNLRDFENSSVVAERVDRWLRESNVRSVDLVVMDPPRSGAAKDVMYSVLRLKPRRVLYVACDPSSLARDVAIAEDLGYSLSQLEAIDSFPQTSHVETFALFEPSNG